MDLFEPLDGVPSPRSRPPLARGAGPPGPRAGNGAAPRPPGDPAAHELGERLLVEGPDRLSTAELVRFVTGEVGPLRDGTGARDVVERLGSLRRAATAAPAELVGRGNLSPAAAARLAAAFALGRRIACERLVRGATFHRSVDFFDRYHAMLRDVRRERFLAVMLDGKNRIMRDEQISEGSLTSSLVHPREVFAPAIRESAAALVLVHNHPSGDPEPSTDDQEITRRLSAAGEIVGIRILDHLVIGDGVYVSFMDRGWIDP